jgi:hypothetical protein
MGRRIIGIDPGPVSCGVVVYDIDAERVLEAHKAMPVDDVLLRIRSGEFAEHVAIERFQATRMPMGTSSVETIRNAGRIEQCAREQGRGVSVSLHYRREVLRALDVTGKGNRDALVRARLIEAHGGSKEAAVGRKATPGPLYGVSGDAWAALAVAYAAGLS